MTVSTKQTGDKPTVVVVDDDPQLREALEGLLKSVDLNVESFESPEAFLEACDPSNVGCLVLDVRMPGMSGLELQRKLDSQGIRIPTLMLTAHADVPMAVESLKAGALDFIEKPYNPQSLLDRIQKILAEQSRQLEATRGLAVVQARLQQLSSREQEVLRLLVTGESTKSIARKLDVSDKTVDFHRRNLLKKMNVATVVELARLVERLDWS
jgi:FixJ family two-component response regulator